MSMTNYLMIFYSSRRLQHLLHALALVVGHDAHVDPDDVRGGDGGDGGGDVTRQRVLQGAAGHREQEAHDDQRLLDGDRVDHPELGDRTLDLGVVDARESLADLVLGDGSHGSHRTGADLGTGGYGG